MEKVTKNEIAEKLTKRKKEEKIKELKKDRDLEVMLRLSEKLGSVALRNISLDWMYKEFAGSRKHLHINQTEMPPTTTKEIQKSNKVTKNDFHNYARAKLRKETDNKEDPYGIIQSVKEREKYMVVKYKLIKRFKNACL